MQYLAARTRPEEMTLPDYRKHRKFEMMHTANVWKQQLMLAGALAVVGPTALASGLGSAREPEVVRVTAPRVEPEIRQTRVDVDVAALIEAVDQAIAKENEQRLEAIGNRRIEIAVSEIRTRG